MRFLRTTFGASTIVARRRARRDAILLAAWMTLVAFVAFLSIEGPYLLIGTIDSGARQAVATAGVRADLVLGSPVGQPNASDRAPVATPSAFESVGDAVPARLPSALRQVFRDEVVTELGPSTSAIEIDGTAPPSTLQVQPGMLTPANTKALTVVSGRLPAGNNGESIDVAISAAAASAAGLTVGDTIVVGSLSNQASDSPASTLSYTVVAIVANRSPASAQFLDLPTLFTPSILGSKASKVTAITVLTTSAGLSSAAAKYSTDGTGRIRVRFDPSKFSAGLERQVGDEITRLSGNSQSLTGSSGVQLAVDSSYSTALAGYPSQSRAALAQMSVMIAGLLGVAAVVVVLLSRLLVLRRNGEILLERSRGSSLVAVAARAAVESLAATVIGGVVGIGVAIAVTRGPIQNTPALVAVLVVAVLATPVQTLMMTRGSLGGRKVPANRQDRAEIASRARARRIAAEVTIVVLGVAALLSLGGRGLLETTTTGIDPFLASAPLLFALVTTIVVLRLYRWPVLGVAALGRRSRGVLGLIGAVRAVRAIAVLPLLALTLALALVVSGGLLVATVNSGQVTASWERTGADVRVDAPIPTTAESRVLAAKGVTAAASVRVATNIQAKLGSTSDFPTVISVDNNFGNLIASEPAGTIGGPDTALFTKLEEETEQTGPGDALPVIVDRDVEDELVTKNIGIYLGNSLVDLHVIGVTSVDLSGFMGGPFIYVDREALATDAKTSDRSNLLLATGPGSLAAVRSAGFATADIHTRADWLRERRGLALVQGTQTTMLLSTIALALLAMIGLISTVLAGARDRGRSLSLLRTLGMRPGLGWWVALAELTPVVIASLIGGIAAGVGMVLLLEPSLGLQVLAGGEGIPQTTVSPWLLAGLVFGTIVLLVVSVLVEVIAHRRERLSEVLRVGETV